MPSISAEMKLKGPHAERSIEQVLTTTAVDGELGVKYTQSNWPRRVREMRNDETVGYLRDMLVAPLLSADWSVVSDAPRYKVAEQRIIDSVMPIRMRFLRDAIRGILDFGWQPYEVVRGFDRNGYVKLVKMKALLQDISKILVDAHGRLRGVRNQPVMTNQSQLDPNLDLIGDDACIIYNDVEGTNWYGNALMARISRAYDSWMACDTAARLYDKKVAGATWVVHYPVGKTEYNGQMLDNYTIAVNLLDTLKASGSLAIPRKVLDFVDDLKDLGEDKWAWKIELIQANGAQGSFVDRLKYLDALKARGLGVPERAVFEGQFGTKAEAEAHADFAIDNIELRHVEILALFNKQVVDPLLDLNDGPGFRGHVRVVASPLSDWKRAQLRQLYMTHFQSEEGKIEEEDAIDWAAVRDTLGLPIRQEAPAPGDKPVAPEQPAESEAESEATQGEDPPIESTDNLAEI